MRRDNATKTARSYGVSDSKPMERQNNSPFTRTVADRPGMRTVSHSSKRVRFTVGSLARRVSDGNAARVSQGESTYISTVVSVGLVS